MSRLIILLLGFSTDYIYLLYSRVQNSGLGGLRHNTVLLIICLLSSRVQNSGLGGLRHNTVLLIIYVFFILGYRTLVWEVYVTIQFY